MSTSSGRSPSNERCQPVSRSSHAGSRSVVRYQLARKRMNGRPPRIPATSIRWAPMVPGSILPAAISVDRRATAASAVDTTPSKGAECVGDHTQRRAESGARVGRPAFGVERRRIAPESHQVEDQLRRVTGGHVRRLLDGQAVHPALDRRQRQGDRLGDESRTRPCAVQGGPAAAAGGFDPLADRGVHAGRPVEFAAGRHHVRTRLEDPAEDVDVGSVGHVEDTVRFECQDLLDVLRRGDPTGSVPHSSPASRPSFSSE